MAARSSWSADLLSEIRFDSNCGGPLPEDANCVSHVTWSGSALVESKSVVWSMAGTVPMVTTTPLFMAGFADGMKAAAGPFSASDYYSSTLPSPLNFVGDFTGHIIFEDKDGAAGTGALVSCRQATGNNGWDTLVASGYFGFGLSCGGTRYLVSTAGVARGSSGTHIFSFGRSGNTIYAKVDGTTTVTNTVSGANDTPGQGPWIGVSAGGGVPLAGKIYEFLGTTTAWNETAVQLTHDVFWRKALQKGFKQTLSVTSADLRTITPKAGGASIILPLNTPGITENGWIASPDVNNTATIPCPFTAARNGRDWAIQADIYSANWSAISGTDVIFSFGTSANPGMLLRFYPARNSVRFQIWQAPGVFDVTFAVTAPADGTTHNFLIGVDKGTAKFYLDGVLKWADFATAPGYTSFPSTINIGLFPGGYYSPHLSFKNIRVMNRMPGR